MEKIITYKKQGDGRDSWRVDYIENDEVVNSEMVYDDPNKTSIPLTDEQLVAAFKRLKELGIIK